jgi:hypothetical protein
MNEKEDTLTIGGGNSFGFSAGEGRASNVFYFAKARFHSPESQGLATLKNAKGWKKTG